MVTFMPSTRHLPTSEPEMPTAKLSASASRAAKAQSAKVFTPRSCAAPHSAAARPPACTSMYSFSSEFFAWADGEMELGQNFAMSADAKEPMFCLRAPRPGIRSKFVSQGSLAHFRRVFSSSLDQSAIGAMNICTFLSFSSRTFSAVMNLNEYLPSLSISTALCADVRPPWSIRSVSAKACAMFVSPLCHLSSSIFFFTRAKSAVRGWTLMAWVMVSSGLTWPLPKRSTPTRIASFPAYMLRYLLTSLLAKSRTMAKPSALSEPLPSIAKMRSCCAMHTSSPMQACVLQASLS
mmetsp:Transcript_65589/g.211582  ORF Transcript_65589/g.211582 Transcript_65589/m.211582 type:complete len:293 (+) Transcript_65589:180-1058(+)